MCIDIVDIWFRLANAQILSIFDSYLPVTRPLFCFRTITSVNTNGFSRNLVCALILRRSGAGLLIGEFRQFLIKLSSRDTSVFSIQDLDYLSNGFSPNLICALILWRSGL